MSQITLHGVVRGVTFERDETGFRVVRIEVEGGAVELVVGVMPRVARGGEVRVVGRRVVDARYGPQIAAESVTSVEPQGREGLEKLLGSGLMKGIGPRLAARVVEHFGDETMRVLDQDPSRLVEVRGVSARVAEVAAAAWGETRASAAHLAHLMGLGLPRWLAFRVIKRFGAATLQVVEREPYRLAHEVPGIGFLTADRLARRAGIPPTAEPRLDAGVVHALGEATERGHTVIDRATVEARAAEVLEVDPSLLRAAVGRCVARGWIVELEGGAVSPRALADAESRVAVRIAALLSATTTQLTRAEEALALVEQRTGLSLAPEQRAAVVAATRERVLVVTGGPGVGKTTIVRTIVALFEAARLSVRLAAPTGRAAKRLSEATSRPAQTLHRLLEVDPKSGGFLRGPGAPLAGDVFIVDEASMIDAQLAASLLEAIPDGSRLVLVGDVDQLPSVGPGAVLRDLLDRAPTARLSTIFRQAAGSQIVESAHLIREGRRPVSSRDARGDFFIVERDDAEAAQRTIVHLVTSRLPAAFGLDPVRDIQVLAPMKKGECGTVALNAALRRALNPQPEGADPDERAPGDKVMQLRNDYDLEVYNGDLGVVVGRDADGALTVRVDDRLVTFAREAEASLALAYAVSIHKSQGSEYPAVVIPWLRSHWVMLSRNLLYTAVTRGKRVVVVVGDPVAIDVALSEIRAEERHTRLPALLDAALRTSR
ncbi:MAG: ATP-dependent RecD-like DNA helicase [Polyangiaceae bacterium]|nr:ATP-dependent RecD-like DNA helicase [Polyangiaceae bacterium]